MRRLLLAGLAVLLGIALPAEAHEVNLVTARVALSPDRSVGVELGLKGSDVDRAIGTKVYDARRDAVDPAAVEAARAPTKNKNANLVNVILLMLFSSPARGSLQKT